MAEPIDKQHRLLQDYIAWKSTRPATVARGDDLPLPPRVVIEITEKPSGEAVATALPLHGPITFADHKRNRHDHWYARLMRAKAEVAAILARRPERRPKTGTSTVRRPVRRLVRTSRRVARVTATPRSATGRAASSGSGSPEPEAGASRPHPVTLRDSERTARAHGLTPQAVSPLGAHCRARRVAR